MAGARSPSFFKVLLDPSAPNLPLPPAFVSKYLKDKIPKNPTLKVGTGEFSWRLKIKEIEGNYCFAHGWNTVVKETQLGFGDFLVFWLIDSSTFHVSIYGPNGCEKDLSLNNTNVQRDCCRKPRNNLDFKAVIKIEDDDDDDVNFCSVKLDEHPSFQKIISDKSHKYIMRLPKEFVGEAGIRDKRSIMVKDLEGREWQIDIQTDKHRSNERYLSSGWSIFREHNELSDGDLCLFKFIKRKGILTLAQVIKKNLARNQENQEKNPNNLTLGGELGKKRKRGRPPLKKPHDGGGDVKSEDESMSEVVVALVKRKRGRPPLKKPGGGGGGGSGEVKNEEGSTPKTVEVVKRKRGRPRLEKRLVDVKIEDGSIQEAREVERKKGRPPLKDSVNNTKCVIYF